MTIFHILDILDISYIMTIFNIRQKMTILKIVIGYYS